MSVISRQYIQTYDFRRIVESRQVFGIRAESSGDDHLHRGELVNAGCIFGEKALISAKQSANERKDDLTAVIVAA